MVIGRHIYDVDYGKMENNQYTHRPENDFHPDDTLYEEADLFSRTNKEWLKTINANRPDNKSTDNTKARRGYVASSDKTLDDPDSPYYRSIKISLPLIEVWEMEAAGVSVAISSLRRTHGEIGFLMIRGISDELRNTVAEEDEEKLSTSEQRDLWIPYAADAAAAFVKAFLLQLNRRQPDKT